MKVHIATVRIACGYIRARGEAEFAPAEGPAPWMGEWKEIERTPVSFDGERDLCTVTYEAKISIWESNRSKAEDQLREWLTRSVEYGPGLRFCCPNRWNRRGFEVISAQITGERNVLMSRNVEVNWADLVDPNGSFHGIWAKPKFRSLRVDVALEVLRDLYVSAEGYEESDCWTTHKTRHLLNGKAARSSFGFGYETEPVCSFDDLRSRFQSALLGRGRQFYDRWRRDNGISLDAKHSLTRAVPHHADGYPSASDLVALFSLRGCKLGEQLNGIHKDAINICGFGVSVSQSGFSFLLQYGYQGSSWSEILAESRLGEPFYETFKRAFEIASAIIPNMKEQISDISWEERNKRFAA